MPNELVVFLNHRIVFELLANGGNGYIVEPLCTLIFLSCKYTKAPLPPSILSETN
jgi:hypothetical protein